MENLNETAHKCYLVNQNYGEEYNVDVSPQWKLLKSMEEFGELTREFFRSRWQTRHEATENDRVNYEDEMTDVIGFLLSFAYEEWLDVQAGLERKWYRHLEK